MIEFMLLGLPRSGTTWAANLLNTERTLCLHDPLFDMHYTDLDKLDSKKTVGVSCTGLYKFPDWVNAHPARKVILQRDVVEVNNSLARQGLPLLPLDERSKLAKIKGWHVPWKEMIENPRAVYEYLTCQEFDEERHAQLKRMRVQPDFEQAHFNKSVTRRLMDELKGE